MRQRRMTWREREKLPNCEHDLLGRWKCNNQKHTVTVCFDCLTKAIYESLEMDSCARAMQILDLLRTMMANAVEP